MTGQQRKRILTAKQKARRNERDRKRYAARTAEQKAHKVECDHKRHAARTAEQKAHKREYDHVRYATRTEEQHARERERLRQASLVRRICFPERAKETDARQHERDRFCAEQYRKFVEGTKGDHVKGRRKQAQMWRAYVALIMQSPNVEVPDND